MKQFEYLFTTVPQSDFDLLWEQPMTDYLNKMGNDGWELIEIKERISYKFNPNWGFLFKREKQTANGELSQIKKEMQ